MIREDSHIESVTILDVDTSSNAKLGYAHFKQALFPDSVIVFYSYKGSYYYPISLEFRLIDNNLLFLFEELKIRDTEKMKKLLASSMLKEEKWTNEFKIAVIELEHEPRYCFKLCSDFKIQKTDYFIHESKLPKPTPS